MKPVLLICSMLLLGTPWAVADEPQRPQLVILNWADYLDPELVEVFEQRHGVEVREVYYESDLNRSQILAESDGAGFDLILTSGIDLSLYVAQGWIAPLNPAWVPNLRHVAERWRLAFPRADTHAVPYFWGTLGIVYRQDLLTQPIDSWMQLLRPGAELQGRIGMMSDGRELLSVALKALGYPLNSADPRHLAEAEALLEAQKPYVSSYQYLMLDERSEIVAGTIRASLAYSGDALMVQEQHEALVYVVPKEGSNMWVDYFAVGAKATHPELAHRFLNFINEPQHAAQMAEFVYYASPNVGAEALLPAEFKSNPAIYPDPTTLERSEFYQQVDPRGMRRRMMTAARIVQ